MQLKAGYFTNGIDTLKTSEAMERKVDALLEQLSYFELATNMTFTNLCEDAAVAVVHNIISRGTPTRASQFVEDILSTTIGKTLKRISDDGRICRDIQKKEVRDMVFRALHIIDPRIKPFQVGNNATTKDIIVADFLSRGAVTSQGDYIWQLAETHRRYSNMFKYSPKLRRHIDILQSDPNYDFLNTECDLCFSAPYADNTADALVFTFDTDLTDTDNTDYITEEIISSLLHTIDVEGRVIVKSADNPYDKTEELSTFIQNGYFDILRDNYTSPLYNTEDGIEALQIALTPLAIARIQKVVVEAINCGALNLAAKSWHIAVIERDVPCAFLAFEDLRQMFSKIFTLENDGRKFPNVKLEIFHTEEFAETELNLLYQGSRDDISEFSPLTKYDLVIDISVLRRVFAVSEPQMPTLAANYAIIRSSQSKACDTTLLFNPYMHYNIAVQSDDTDCNDDADDDDCEDDEDYDDESCFDEQADALRYFLKNIFALNDFLPGQAATISHLLNGNNVLHVSSPATGKTLMMLFAAMMKPGYTFVLPPTIAVMDTQFHALRDRGIDVDYYINPVLQNSYDRSVAARDVMEGRSLITFLSPSLIHDPYIRNIFRGIDQRGIPICYIMLDEAQRISLQTADFRAYYQDIRNIIAGNFSSENTPMLRMGAFSSTMETNIQNEIAEKLQADVTIIKKPDFSNLSLTVRETGMTGLGNTDDLAAYSRMIKQQEVERIISNDNSKHKSQRTIIFSAQPPFDTKDSSGEPYKVSGKQTMFYTGDIDEAGIPVTSSEAQRSMKSLKSFCDGNGDVLSATQAAGFGIHAAGVGRIVHMEPPMSLDRFCRMNGRASSLDKPHVDVIVNTTNKDFVGTETIRDDKGNLSSVQNIIATNFDTAANLQRLLNQNPGNEKEKAVMHEILNGVMFPERTYRQNIIDAVYNEFNVEIETDTEPMMNPHQLYIYTKGRSKSLGYIDFKARQLNMPEMQYDRPMAEKIQSYIFDIISDNNDNPLAYLAEMEKELPAEECDGIQTALDAVMEGQKAEVVIPFYSNTFADAAELLKQNQGINIRTADIIRCYDRTVSYSTFEQMLSRDTEARPRTLEDKRKLEFKNLYQSFRNKKDTLRAVSRLKEIDIVDDYLVNTASGIVTVYLTKHNKDFYRMKLLPILQRNLTRERMLAYITGIEEEKFLSMEKYTDVLIDFFYSEIQPLYERSALEASKFFATVLARQKEGTLSKDTVARNLQNYFTSRYKCSFVFDSDTMGEASPSTIDKIVHLIDKAGSNINSLMNLQVSINMDDPENRTPSNKIIYGYCQLFTEKNATEQSRFDSYATICDGLHDYRRKHSVEEFEEELDTIINKIADENYDLKEEAEEVLPLQLQSHWLKWFNAHVLKTDEIAAQ